MEDHDEEKSPNWKLEMGITKLEKGNEKMQNW